MALATLPIMVPFEYEPGYKDIDLGPTMALIRSMPRPDEYNSIIRLDNRYIPRIPWTHELILDSEPLHIRQYCRTMTLAQGRVLYQLWDDGQPWNTTRHCGYIVPRVIVHEARAVSANDRSEDWKGLLPGKRRQCEEAWENVVRAWPGIPVFAARRVVEEMVNMRGGKYSVDEAVKSYAKRYWTSYRVRLEARGVSEWNASSNWKVVKEVEEQVARKLREVLSRWTRPGVALGLDFLEHHELLNAPKQPESSVQSSLQFRRFS
jgi:hypothetical protein